VFSELAGHTGQRSQSQARDDLKLVTDTFNFIVKYDIETLADMAAVMKNMRSKYDALKAETTKTARRYAALAEHIKQAEAYSKNSKVYSQWRGMKGGGKKDQFYDKHKDGIAAFAEAHKYMARHLNGRKEIPLDSWKREFATVKNEHAALLADSDNLSRELRSAEAIRRNAEKVMGAQQQARSRGHGIG
jgi:chromosome segregation ATPase